MLQLHRLPLLHLLQLPRLRLQWSRLRLHQLRPYLA